MVTGTASQRNSLVLDTMSKVRNYEVTSHAPSELAKAELAACLAIIENGEAVDLDSAAAELPRASVVAIARIEDKIVGVGAIKRVRSVYAARIADRSGFAFKANTPEIGYVAIDRNHQGQRLSSRIVGELASKHPGPLFATTDDERMQRTLTKAGFMKSGCEWRGQRGMLSLWIRFTSGD
jgi:hypothetical protein